MTERTINMLKTFGGDSKINNKLKRRFKPRDIGTMFSIIWNLVITNKDRKYYLHIFSWTYKNKPEFISLAFFSALVMFQYRIILVPYLLQELEH
jgi:hypothetical protein